MISFDGALPIFLAAAQPPGCETVPLYESAGRILGADVSAWRDVPVRNLSAMDGFACRMADREKPLTVIETIAAGKAPLLSVGPGQCSRIMTGAIIPVGAGCVVMFEDTSEHDGVIIVNKIRSPMNVRTRGEDQRRGDRVLTAGTLITPAVTGVLASEGCDPVTVTIRPKVGIIATGDELVEPDQTPADHQIRNTNSALLCAQVRVAGCEPSYFGICPDSHEGTMRVYREALSTCDVVMFSGGVSAGDFDFVQKVIVDSGMRVLIDGIAVKPGKPTVFATSGDHWVIGLPGNPVASLVIFETLVKPFLYRMSGGNFPPRRVCMRLAADVSRMSTDRMEFVPVTCDPSGTVSALPYHGSAHLYAYTRAQGIIAFPPGVALLEQGSTAEVTLL